ncbi:MAG: NAD-dependent epimerase/dehydratase family protein [Chloroflexi bacterium]|nr:NAD-dependent epimerase/dehydratase family protein [Chloroflexota bacterium]
MRVLVMGGTRFNGLALVHELAKHGHEVTVLNRGQTEAKLPRGVRRLYADRHDHAALRAVFRDEKFDCVQDISAYTLDDVRSIVEIFRGRIAHYVFASSTVIYAAAKVLPIREGDPVDRSPRQSEYGLNKLICEDYLVREHRERGFPATIVPFSMVFGPHNIIPDREQRMFMRMLTGRPVLVPGDGTTLAQVGHVDDEARALRMLMLNPVTFGKRYNLTGSDYWSDEGYVDTFAQILGVEVRKRFVPPALMDEVWAGGQTRHMIQRLAPYIHHWNESVVFSVDRLRRDVAFEPEYRFASAVEQTYEWFRAERLDETLQFDWSEEDRLLERMGAE